MYNSSNLEQCKKAAEQGDSDAQLRLGMMYGYGIDGVPVDYRKALYWARLSEMNGNDSAREVVEEILRIMNMSGWNG